MQLDSAQHSPASRLERRQTRASSDAWAGATMRHVSGWLKMMRFHRVATLRLCTLYLFNGIRYRRPRYWSGSSPSNLHTAKGLTSFGCALTGRTKAVYKRLRVLSVENHQSAGNSSCVTSTDRPKMPGFPPQGLK